MRSSTVFKTIAAFLAIIGTHILTKDFIRARVTHNNQAPAASSAGFHSGNLQLPQNDVAIQVASGAMHKLDVRVEGNSLRITALASLTDSRPLMKYIWSIRFLDLIDENKILNEYRYDTQSFTAVVGQTIRPTFDDVVLLPFQSDKYRVEVAIYQLQPGQALDSLKDPNRARQAIGPSGQMLVRRSN